MKLKALSISNLLSFALVNIDLPPQFVFEEGINILIGPNGTGKSNFVAILHEIFEHILFKRYQLGWARLPEGNDRIEMQKNFISLSSEGRQYHLRRHRGFEKYPTEIKLVFQFNDYDRTNMFFVAQHFTTLNNLIKKYSRLTIELYRPPEESVINQLTEFKVTLHQDRGGSYQWLFEKNADENNFVKSYLENFELIRYLIILSNQLEATQWSSLRNTFTFLGAYRSYNAASPSYTLEPNIHNSTDHARKLVRDQHPLLVNGGDLPFMNLVQRKLALTYAYLHNEGGDQYARQKIQEDALIKNINDVIRLAPLFLQFQIQKDDPATLQYNFDFYNIDNGTKVDIMELSSGQKNILSVVFSLFGNDLTSGLFVIDEPELHLHPQAQEDFFNILQKTAKDLDLQCIVVTHSSAFVKPSSIQNLFRFYKDQSATGVIHPLIEYKEKALLNVINISNSNKIFFARKIILVEGETDEYFFRFLFDRWHPKTYKSSPIEVINIKGKGQYYFWKTFLDKFHIQHYYIGDWDNAVSFGLITQERIDEMASTDSASRKKVEASLDKKNSTDKGGWLTITDQVLIDPNNANLEQLKKIRDYLVGRNVDYPSIIANIQKSDSTAWNNLLDSIESLKDHNIFLLKQGEIEDYLCVRKGMEAMIEFINNSFESWEAKKSTGFMELREIFSHILQ